MRMIMVLLAVLVLFGCDKVKEQDYVLPEDILVFDVWEYFDKVGINTIEERADALYFITSLQGIVNRDAPRLHLFASLALFDVETKCHYDPDYKNKPVTKLDEFWFSHFEKEGYLKGRKVEEISNLKSLVSRYRSKVNGLVVWDMKLPATSNIAMMAAGCEDLLPVSKDLGDGKFYKKVKEACPWLKVELDISGKFDGKKDIVVGGKSYPTTGSAKNDAYKYAIEKYLRPGIANPYKMWFNCDAAMWGKFRSHYNVKEYGHLGDKNELQQNGMYNGDYWVSQRAIFFDLLPWADCKPKDDPDQPLGADNKTWHDILEVSYHQRKGEFGIVGGFIPWWIKYTTHTGGKHADVESEWEFVSLLSSYNMGNDGDAAFGIANASFFQHLPAISKEQAKFRDSSPIEYDSDATYIAILMMDYDGSAWTNQMIPSVYNDPARGKMPLNWCINPALNERIPHAIKYIYDNRGDNDFLGFSCDGVCYVQPDSFSNRKGRIKESGIPYYEKYAKKINERYGIKYNIFYIDDTFSSEWTQMAARITSDGFGCNLPIKDQLVNGTPVNMVIHYHISDVPALAMKLEEYYKESVSKKQYSARFQALRCILITPTQIYSAVEQFNKKYPDAKVKFVDVQNFYRLLKHKLENPAETPCVRKK